MRVFSIEKRPGVFRKIYAPDKRERRRLQELVPLLAEGERNYAARMSTEQLNVSSVAHGFIVGRNPVTAAMRHVNRLVTVSMDIANWFDSVSCEQLRDAEIPDDVIDAITIDGFLRQGLPTSPSAANWAAIAMDRSILGLLDEMERYGWIVDPVYTRYADDVTVSFNDGDPEVIIGRIALRVRNWWTIATEKTTIQYAQNGRRIILGLAVDSQVHMTRHTRRRIRAAEHNGQLPQLRGLREWGACKLPRSLTRSRLVNLPLVLPAKPKRATPTIQEPRPNHAPPVQSKGRLIYLG